MNASWNDAITEVVLAQPIEADFNDCTMSRLINAALVDKNFCELLLTNPALALEQGCYGERFNLTPLERLFVLTACSSSLADFADQWLRFNDT